jgi:glucose-6-phosphate 1-epimerase
MTDNESTSNGGSTPSAQTGAGEGGMPRVVLAHPRGGRAEVYLHGAHVASWSDANGGEMLFLSRRSKFDPTSAIRGGVPVIFPQFADRGPLPKHGFARTAEWRLVDSSASGDEARAVFRLTESPATREIWNHAFAAEFTAALGDALTVTLSIENTGDEPMEFTCALHTYLRVEDIRRTTVAGLAGLRYEDKVEKRENTQPPGALEIAGETDRIYFSAPDELRVRDDAGDRTIVARKTGFADVVVWNPWSHLAASLPDLEDDDYLRFLCIEAANIGTPVRLAPGERWSGSQTIAQE